ncbi:hypothetical protein SDC9_153875 [bioreactor metagenome]|uniref:Uncharacterized protein n=1 Tax=bioreactor metagenome TaxID=1076179 RepID=A0A645EZK7_9ZZZZ
MLFNLINHAHNSILLEFIELVPYFSLLKSSFRLNNIILCQFVQVFVKYVIQRNEVNKLWRILLIQYTHMLQNLLFHILNSTVIIP